MIPINASSDAKKKKAIADSMKTTYEYRRLKRFVVLAIVESTKLLIPINQENFNIINFVKYNGIFNI